MSNSASLAAAKNRRSRPTNVQFNSVNDEQKVEKKTITPIQMLMNHDYKIFLLEEKMKEIKLEDGDNMYNYVTKKELELFKVENSVSSKVDNKIKNTVDDNCANISDLKTNLNNVSKIITDLNSTIQMLKAASISQTHELNELRSILEKETNNNENSDNTETVDDVDNGDNVENEVKADTQDNGENVDN